MRDGPSSNALAVSASRLLLTDVNVRHVNAGDCNGVVPSHAEIEIMRVADICTRCTVNVGMSESVRVAAELMRKRHVGSLVVIGDSGNGCDPLGILTDRDIVLAVTAAGADPESLTVGDVMTRSPATCADDDDLFDAIGTMRTRGVRRLPVIDAEGRLAGVISVDDIYGTLGAQLCELGLALTRGHVREMETRT